MDQKARGVDSPMLRLDRFILSLCYVGCGALFQSCSFGQASFEDRLSYPNDFVAKPTLKPQNHTEGAGTH
jgi:hypothetical protein